MITAEPGLGQRTRINEELLHALYLIREQILAEPSIVHDQGAVPANREGHTFEMSGRLLRELYEFVDRCGSTLGDRILSETGLCRTCLLKGGF